MADVETAAAPVPAAAAQTVTAEPSAFLSALRKELRPKDQAAEARIQEAVDTLAQQALQSANLVSSDVVKTIQAIIAQLDQKLTEQANQILHHDEFQQLEGSWRGLHSLINNTETDEMLKIRVLSVAKNDLAKSLEKFEGTAWDQSPLFKAIYTSEYSMFGGEPYGCLVGDYHFDNSPRDVGMLRNMAKVSAASHTPFIAGAGPSLFNMESWQELMNPRDLTKITTTPDYASWNSLRQSEDSRYIGLAMPRVLSRLPYGSKTKPIEGFAFEEATDGSDHHKYAWMNAAWAMAVNINRSFKLYGWCSRIRGVESGGAVTNLPVHTFPTDDGGVAMKCPTEIAIDDRREAELAKLGLMPILHRKNTDVAAFIGAQSLNFPDKFDDPDATANANLSAPLPYMFAVCRFAHYLKAMVRDKVGSYKEKDELTKWLQVWINEYVDSNPKTSSETVKAKRPLADAKVEVFENEENPGYYNARFYLRPHFQLEAMDIGLSLVSGLPAPSK